MRYVICACIATLFLVGRCGGVYAQTPVNPHEGSVLSTLEVKGWKVDPHILLSHTSAFTRGEPFRPELGEATMDRIELGVTFTKGRWAVDLSQGWKCINCALEDWGIESEESTTVTVRFYPWRRKHHD